MRPGVKARVRVFSQKSEFPHRKKGPRDRLHAALHISANCGDLKHSENSANRSVLAPIVRGCPFIIRSLVLQGQRSGRRNLHTSFAQPAIAATERFVVAAVAHQRVLSGGTPFTLAYHACPPLVLASADLMPEQPCSCVRRLNEKRGLTCLCCGRIDDIGAAVAIAGCDECRRHVITE